MDLQQNWLATGARYISFAPKFVSLYKNISIPEDIFIQDFETMAARLRPKIIHCTKMKLTTRRH